MHRRTGVSMARSEQLATTEVLEPLRHDLWDPLKRTQDPPAAAHRMRCGSQCGAKRALSSVRVSTRQRVRHRVCAGSGRAQRNHTNTRTHTSAPGLGPMAPDGTETRAPTGPFISEATPRRCRVRHACTVYTTAGCLLPESKGHRSTSGWCCVAVNMHCLFSWHASELKLLQTCYHISYYVQLGRLMSFDAGQQRRSSCPNDESSSTF